MADERDIGARIGAAIARAVEAMGLGDAIRNALASKHGQCRVCSKPFDEKPQEDPGDICKTCHADELLAATFGVDSDRGGDA